MCIARAGAIMNSGRSGLEAHLSGTYPPFAAAVHLCDNSQVGNKRQLAR